MAAKSSKAKKIKYKKISFKLSAKQKTIIDRCCLLEKTTHNKFIKTAIKEHVMKYAERIAQQDANVVSENQLALFDFDNIGQQMDIFVEDDMEDSDEE